MTWGYSPENHEVFDLADQSSVCMLLAGGADRERGNLIAASPDLYAALERLFASYKDLADSGDAGFWSLEDLDEGKQALAALARARGETVA
jgi:hypothetical protein